MRPLKVYGWIGYRGAACQALGARPGRGQTREIIAARSRAEAARLADESLSHLRNFGSETGNPEELTQATREPGVLFWRPLDIAGAWQRVAPGTPGDPAEFKRPDSQKV